MSEGTLNSKWTKINVSRSFKMAKFAKFAVTALMVLVGIFSFFEVSQAQSFVEADEPQVYEALVSAAQNVPSNWGSNQACPTGPLPSLQFLNIQIDMHNFMPVVLEQGKYYLLYGEKVKIDMISGFTQIWAYSITQDGHPWWFVFGVASESIETEVRVWSAPADLLPGAILWRPNGSQTERTILCQIKRPSNVMIMGADHQPFGGDPRNAEAGANDSSMISQEAFGYGQIVSATFTTTAAAAAWMQTIDSTMWWVNAEPINCVDTTELAPGPWSEWAAIKGRPGYFSQENWTPIVDAYDHTVSCGGRPGYQEKFIPVEIPEGPSCIWSEAEVLDWPTRSMSMKTIIANPTAAKNITILGMSATSWVAPASNVLTATIQIPFTAQPGVKAIVDIDGTLQENCVFEMHTGYLPMAASGLPTEQPSMCKAAVSSIANGSSIWSNGQDVTVTYMTENVDVISINGQQISAISNSATITIHATPGTKYVPLIDGVEALNCAVQYSAEETVTMRTCGDPHIEPVNSEDAMTTSNCSGPIYHLGLKHGSGRRIIAAKADGWTIEYDLWKPQGMGYENTTAVWVTNPDGQVFDFLDLGTRVHGSSPTEITGSGLTWDKTSKFEVNGLPGVSVLAGPMTLKVRHERFGDVVAARVTIEFPIDAEGFMPNSYRLGKPADVKLYISDVAAAGAFEPSTDSGPMLQQ